MVHSVIKWTTQSRELLGASFGKTRSWCDRGTCSCSAVHRSWHEMSTHCRKAGDKRRHRLK